MSKHFSRLYIRYYDSDSDILESIILEADLNGPTCEQYKQTVKDIKVGELQTINDRYRSYSVRGIIPVKGTIIRLEKPIPKEINGMNVEFVNETYDEYQHKLHDIDIGNYKWIYNIIDGKEEQDRILLRTERFILIPDFIWTNREDMEQLHVLGIAQDKRLRSLREIDFTDIGLLEEIKRVGSKMLNVEYGVKENKIKIYVHYPPSTYHLHIHFTAMSMYSHKTAFERCHDIDTIIKNIKLDPMYYKTDMKIIEYDSDQ